MKPRIAFLVSLFVLGAVPAMAQTSSSKPAPSNGAVDKQLVGTWEGTFQSDHGAGNIRMVIARDSAWKVTFDIIADQAIPSSAVTDFKVEGSKVAWNQELMGMACASSAAHDADTLKGQTSCGQAGITFELKKK